MNDIGFRSKVRRAEDEGDEEFKCASSFKPLFATFERHQRPNDSCSLHPRYSYHLTLYASTNVKPGAYFETCLLDGGGVDASGQVVDGGRLFCYEPFNGEAEYMCGYELSFATGTYYTPEDERGNLLEGPCPGEMYEPSPSGGCQPVKRSKEDAEDGDDRSASPTPSTSTLPKSTAAESAGVEATVTGQTNNGDGLNSCHGPVWMVMYLAMMIAGVLL